MTNQQEKQTTTANEKGQDTKNTNKSGAPAQSGANSNEKKGGKPAPKSQGQGQDAGKDEFEQKILDIARVTRVMAGGKRMSFRACVAVGDKNGKIGVGLGKGADVAVAVSKGADQAKKNMVSVPLVYGTIPHEIKYKYGAAEILFKPSKQGRGIIAGGIVRVVLELAGVKNVTSKILGTNNKMNNAKCTVEAMRNLKRVDASKLEENKDKKEESAKDTSKEQGSNKEQ